MTKAEIESLLVAIAEATGRLHSVESEYLKALRQEHGWNQYDLAEAIGSTQSFVSMVESGYGDRHFQPSHWQRLFEALDSFCPRCGQGMGAGICPHCGYEKGENGDYSSMPELQ